MGQSKLERGKLMKAVGMAGKTQPAEQQLQATQPADAPSGTGLEETTSRWPVLQQKQQLPQMMSACRAVRRGGVQSCWQPERRVQTYLSVSTPPNAFACHCPYPLP